MLSWVRWVGGAFVLAWVGLGWEPQKHKLIGRGRHVSPKRRFFKWVSDGESGSFRRRLWRKALASSIKVMMEMLGSFYFPNSFLGVTVHLDFFPLSCVIFTQVLQSYKLTFCFRWLLLFGGMGGPSLV